MSATGVLQVAKSLSAAATSYSGVVDLGNANATSVGVIVNVTAIKAACTLTLSVQWSNDGDIWADGDPGDTFTVFALPGSLARTFSTKGRRLRLKEVLAGVAPTATYTSSLYYAVNS